MVRADQHGHGACVARIDAVPCVGCDDRGLGNDGLGVARHKRDRRIGRDRDDRAEMAMAGIFPARPGGDHQAIACIDLYLRQFHTSKGDGRLRTMSRAAHYVASALSRECSPALAQVIP